LNQTGQPDEAITIGKKAVDLQLQHPELRLRWPQDNQLLGELLFNKGQFAQAIPFLQTAAEIEPDYPHLLEELSEAKKRAATQPADR
jgi:tetratricopeptide (TPR) repeat protein